MNIAHYLESAEYMAKRAGAKRLATELRDARWEINHGYWPEFTAQQSAALRDVGYTGVTGHDDMPDLTSPTIQSLGGI